MHNQLASGGSTARVPVLMYHRVGDASSAVDARYCVTAKRFSEHMHALARQGFRAAPIESMVAWLNGGPPLGDRDFVLTFDDGFRGVLTHALPILKSLDWPFTVFLVTDLLGGTDTWARNDGGVGAPQPLLREEDLQPMASCGASFHSHSCRHLKLPKLADVELHHELTASRETLDRILGAADRYVAYPYGQTDDRVVAAARRAGYKAAFSVESGFNRRDVDRFRIRRLDIAGTDSVAALLRKIRLGSNDGSRMAGLRYLARRAAARFGMHST